MISASLARWGHPPAAGPAPGENLARPPAPAEAGSGLTRQSAIHAFRSQLTEEASSRYGLTSQDAEFDAFTSGASWAWATYVTAIAGGFGQAPQAGEVEANERHLREELDLTDRLLENREQVLRAIPECPIHGPGCVPHAMEWIERAKAREAKV
jgi:hypothetical protein